MAISAVLKKTIINSVACGDAALAEVLTRQYCIIEAIAQAELEPTCRPDLQVTQTQLGLVEFAMSHARNLIDTTEAFHTSEGKRENHLQGWRTSDGTTKGQSTSKFKARGDSFTNFTRTGEAHDKGFSAARGQSDGRAKDQRSDRGRRRSGTTSAGFDEMNELMVGSGAGNSCFRTESDSKSKVASGPGATLATGTAIDPVAAVQLATGIIFDNDNTFVDIDDIEVQPKLGGLGGFAVDGIDPIVNLPVSAICPTALATVTLGEVAPLLDDFSCIVHPNSGESKRYSTNLSYSWTASLSGTIGPATIEVSVGGGWTARVNEGDSFRFNGVCSNSYGRKLSESSSKIFYAEHSGTETNSEDRARAQSKTTHDMNQLGQHERHSAHALHAVTKGQMRSCDESHSGNRRRSHGEGQGSDASQTFTQAHKERHGSFKDKSTGRTTIRYWNQIFKQLADLYKTLTEQVRNEREVSSHSMPTSMTCGSPATKRNTRTYDRDIPKRYSRVLPGGYYYG